MDSSIYESTCKNDVLRSVTEEYLTMVNIGQMSPAKIEADLLERELMAFELHNLTVDKGQKWRCPDSLTPLQIAMCINKKHIVRLINLGSRSNSREFMPLGIYVDIKDDDRYGTYVLDRTYLSRIIRGFNYTILSSEIEEVFRALRDIVEVVNTNDTVCDLGFFFVHNIKR